MTVFERAGVALSLILGLVSSSALAQTSETVEPKASSNLPAPASAPETPAPVNQATPATPTTPTTQATAPPTPVGPSTQKPDAAPAPAERKQPALDIEIPGNIVGSKLESLKRTLGPASDSGAQAPSLRNLKRLSREEILAATNDTLSTYVLRDSERTLIFDFPNTREQARTFARLILFIERAGSSKTRVMTVPDVQKWLVQNSVQFDTLTVGNNMRTGELARFFNSARFQGEPLTMDEQRLYDWLLRMQLLREEEAGVAVVDPERILVSVPQVSTIPGCPACTVSAEQRAVILQHELSHARFATDTVYQNYVVWFWSNAMSLVARDKFMRFLKSRGYDSSIRELCANEMQAFLMHTPDPRMFAASDVGLTDAELADLRRRFQEGLSPKPRASADKPYAFE